MNWSKLKSAVRTLASPITLLTGVGGATVFTYYIGLWFQKALGSIAPSGTPTIFASIGFFGSLAGGLWLFGNSED